MIRNVFIKNALINTIFRGVSWLNILVKKNDRMILLYSDTTFRDNTRYLYDYLVSNRYNARYTIVCACKDYQDYTAGENVIFVKPLKAVLYYLRSAHVFYSFGKLPITPTREQTVIQMWHGTSFKGFAENQKKTNSVRNQFYTYVYASSDYFAPIVKDKFQVDIDKVVVCGHPRTDILYRDTPQYDLGNYKKIIIWMPTFRKSRELGEIDASGNSVVPVVKNEELVALERYLESLNIGLIIKLHPEQDTDDIPSAEFKHIDLMTHKEFVAKGYDLYALMRHTDALITDYSSVFYDYLLLDRPIGFTEDDMKDYGERRGFAVDDPDAFRPGPKIVTFDDLKTFIKNVAEGNDQYKDSRKYVNDLANQYQDGKNCARTLELSHVTLD